MNTKTFKQFLKNHLCSESIIDKPSTLLSEIFKNRDNLDKPGLLPIIKNEIEDGIKKLQHQFSDIKVKDYFIVGSSVTYQYNDHSDIDITVVYKENKNLTSDKLAEISNWTNSNLNGIFLFLERKAINYYITISWSRNNLDNVDAAYDPIKDVWIKKPEQGQEVTYYDSLIDSSFSVYHNETRLYEEEIKKKLRWFYNILLAGYCNSFTNLQYELGKLYLDYEQIHSLRKDAYDKDELTSDEISLNWDYYNIMYKFMEQDHYMDFYSYVKIILHTDRCAVTDNEINQYKYNLLLTLNNILA